jgi:hypothetical protein
MIIVQHLLVATMLAFTTNALAFESDVHYGLTQWLALKAGFGPLAAETIAIGNNRVDSGDMQFIDLVLMYACVAKDDEGMLRAGQHHYPTAVTTRAAPEQRVVVAGGDAARKAAQAGIKIAPEQAGFLLLKVGEALHALQDSWAHQGVPDVSLSVGGSVACDPLRAWGHPKARGGAQSHKADLTSSWPADTVAMAKATYESLLQYPPISGAERTPRKWDEIRPTLDKFVAAATKTEKRRWFATQGIDNASFLEGTSLPDGAERFDLKWAYRRLPPLALTQSRQHQIAPDLLDFYSRFFMRWVSTMDFAKLAAEFGGSASPQDAKRPGAPATGNRTAELAARLKAWRLRDHGVVANLGHTLAPLTAAERATIDAAGNNAGAYARYKSPGDSFFPLLPRSESASPLVPFFIATIPSSPGKNPAAIAVTKFRHLPYDTIAVVTEKIGSNWRVVSVAAVADH